jgi:hypothetical protein
MLRSCFGACWTHFTQIIRNKVRNRTWWHWFFILVDLAGLTIGLVGLGFSIANIASECIHHQDSIQETLQALHPSIEISCLHWMDIVGLTLSSIGLALAVVSGLTT